MKNTLKTIGYITTAATLTTILLGSLVKKSLESTIQKTTSELTLNKPVRSLPPIEHTTSRKTVIFTEKEESSDYIEKMYGSAYQNSLSDALCGFCVTGDILYGTPELK